MKLTRFGAVVIAILIVCAVVVTVAPGAPRILAVVVGVLFLFMLGGDGLSGGAYWPGNNLERMNRSDRKREVLTREARRRR